MGAELDRGGGPRAREWRAGGQRVWEESGCGTKCEGGSGSGRCSGFELAREREQMPLQMHMRLRVGEEAGREWLPARV